MTTSKRPSLGEKIKAAAQARIDADAELKRLVALAHSRGASYRDIEEYAGVSYAQLCRWIGANKKNLSNPLDLPE